MATKPTPLGWMAPPRGRRVLAKCFTLVALLMALAIAQETDSPRTEAHPPHSAVEREPTADAEGGEGGHEVRSTAGVAVGVITILVLVSILFEIFTESLREGADEMNMPFINTIFSELTTLGFIGLVLFIITKLDILSSLSEQLLGDEKHLQETIEVLHMGLFLFILIFLVLCVGLLRFGTRVQDEWREFERSSSDIPAVVTEYVLATEPTRSWTEYLSVSRRDAARKCHREMVYLALRRRFIDYRSNHPDETTALQLAKEFQRNPDVRFPFNEYLSLISGEVMARLIEIDLPTWVALEVFLVSVLGLCYAVGPMGEIFVLLACGFVLILMNRTVSQLIRAMRHKLTPPRLMKDAERLRRKNEWRAKHHLPLYNVNEKTWIMDGAETSDSDLVPPYLDTLPHGGLHMSEIELADAQCALLLPGRGKNGAQLALFCTRLVFLLTALHLSVFLMRTMHLIYTHVDNALAILVLYGLFLLPSVLVPSMSVKIARDGLYAFNIEHMKVNRVISRVMRILKARQTLRTLRFVAEMKIYLKENVRRKSSVDVMPVSPLPLTAALHEATARFANIASKKTPKKAKAQETSAASPPPPLAPPSPKQSISQARRKSLTLQVAGSPSASGVASPLMSPLAAYYSPRGKRSDAYRLETERREIHTIFCLFDVDGSGAVSRDEMAGLLRAITHDLTDDQITHLMRDLLQDEAKAASPKAAKASGSSAPPEDEITFECFYNWCHQHIQESHHSKDELIEEIFQMIDTDASGFITVDEFIAIFKTLGQSLDHDDVRELVYQMDRNDDGKIDLEEFTKMLQKHEV